MSRRYKNIKGRKFHELTVLEYSRSGADRGAIWVVQCDCGNVLEAVGRELVSGRKKTCGSHGKGLGIRSSMAIVTSMLPKGMRQGFANIIKKAIREGKPRNLTAKEYIEITRKPCLCCGSADTTGYLADPDGPVDITNVVSLCDKCRRLQGDLSIEKLLKQVLRIATHITPQLNSEY